MPYKDATTRRAHEQKKRRAKGILPRTRMSDDERRKRQTQYHARYRLKHLDAYRAYHRNYQTRQRANNPEKYRTAGRAYYAKTAEKRRLEASIRRQNNPTQHRAIKAAAYAKDPEKYRARKRAEYARDPIKARLQHQTWIAKHRETYLASRHASEKRRRAAKTRAPSNDFTAAQWKAMLEHYDHRCQYCGRKMKRLTMDHITPLSKGGSHTVHNIIPACTSCNSRKHTGTPPRPVQPMLF